MKGDKIVVTVDTGGDLPTEYVIDARKGGRTVAFAPARGGMIAVEECKRNGGEAVRTFMFMSSRIIALVEYKADLDPGSDEPAQLFPGDGG